VGLREKNMNIKPLNDRVVVKPAEAEQVTKSGIVLPDTADKERPEQGEVIAVGEGKILENGSRAKMSVKVGDIIMFKKYSPDEVKVGDEEYLVISEGDILAIIK
jgi:chaperonin GroES